MRSITTDASNYKSIIDSLPAHKAKLVRDYVETTNGKLKLYFLPGYAPELNPDELVWSHTVHSSADFSRCCWIMRHVAGF